MYHYRLTLESLAVDVEPPSAEGSSIQFQIQNHHDLLKIVEAVRSKTILDDDKSAALAIGLKLFAAIVIERHGDSLFRSLLEPLQSFIRQLKTVEPITLSDGNRG